MCIDDGTCRLGCHHLDQRLIAVSKGASRLQLRDNQHTHNLVIVNKWDSQRRMKRHIRHTLKPTFPAMIPLDAHWLPAGEDAPTQSGGAPPPPSHNAQITAI